VGRSWYAGVRASPPFVRPGDRSQRDERGRVKRIRRHRRPIPTRAERAPRPAATARLRCARWVPPCSPGPPRGCPCSGTPASIVIESQATPGPNDPGRCIAVSFLQFGEVAGATKYEGLAHGLLGSSDVPGSGPPFPDDRFSDFPALFIAPAGVHRFALGSSSVGTGCADAEAGQAGRFSVVFMRATVDSAAQTPTTPVAPPAPVPACFGQTRNALRAGARRFSAAREHKAAETPGAPLIIAAVGGSITLYYTICAAYWSSVAADPPTPPSGPWRGPEPSRTRASARVPESPVGQPPRSRHSRGTALYEGGPVVKGR
jgi:hypothetical protein